MHKKQKGEKRNDDRIETCMILIGLFWARYRERRLSEPSLSERRDVDDLSNKLQGETNSLVTPTWQQENVVSICVAERQIEVTSILNEFGLWRKTTKRKGYSEERSRERAKRKCKLHEKKRKSAYAGTQQRIATRSSCRSVWGGRQGWSAPTSCRCTRTRCQNPLYHRSD